MKKLSAKAKKELKASIDRDLVTSIGIDQPSMGKLMELTFTILWDPENHVGLAALFEKAGRPK